MNHEFEIYILQQTGAKALGKQEIIQELWSGYGQIIRIELIDAPISSVVLKHIDLKSAHVHPRGWNTNLSHLRKVRSYEVELEWYRNWNHFENFKIPKCLGISSIENHHLILLEDLDASGFPKRMSHLSLEQAKVCVKWLAHFHGNYLQTSPKGIWQKGTYWHLDTRPDEWDVMVEGDLKNAAKELDTQLSNATYQTIVHGDAKVANFCFSSNLKEVAAVDFQYVGGGCGMKDLAYFMGSCLTEEECELYAPQILDYYFKYLKSSIAQFHPLVDAEEVEKEWRELYPVAWADFMRFLLGWMPTHQKINSYSLKMVQQALKK